MTQRTKTCLAILLFVCWIFSGCDSQSEKPTSQFEVGSETTSPPDESNPATPQENLPLEEETNVQKLASVAKMMMMQVSNQPPERRAELLGSLLKVANRMHQLDMGEQERVFAIQAKTNALLQLYGLGQSDRRQELLDFVATYENDRDPNAKRVSLSAMAAVYLSDFLSTKDETEKSFGLLKNQVAKFLTAFPESQPTLVELQEISAQLMLRQKRAEAIEVMTLMQAQYEKSTNEQFKKFSRVLADRIFLAENEFDLIVDKMRNGNSESESRFLELAKQIASMKDLGPTLYQEVISASRWLESNDSLADAKRLLELLAENMAEYSDEQIRKRAEHDSATGLKRLSWQGKKMVVVGQDSAGSKISSSDTDKQVNVLIFWSAKQPQSVRALQRLLPIYDEFEDKEVSFFAVCTDKQISDAISIFQNQAPPWKTIYRSSDEADQATIDDTGIQFVPYVVILDKDQIAKNINVRLIDLPERILQLLDKKSSE